MVVERVPVIQNEDRPDVNRVERGEKRVIGLKVVLALGALDRVPVEIHAHPAHAGIGQGLQVESLRVDGVDVHADRFRNLWLGAFLGVQRGGGKQSSENG